MNQELIKNKKENKKIFFRRFESLILRIRYNWKTYIIRIIIGLLPVIPLIMFAKNFDKIEILNGFIKTFTYNISGYNISLIHILVYIITSSLIIFIMSFVLKNRNVENYNENMRNALIKNERKDDILWFIQVI